MDPHSSRTCELLIYQAEENPSVLKRPLGGRATFRLRISEDRPMLILTRRVGESLMIGDEITVTVVDIKGNQIRLGIQAPKEIPVHREEVYVRLNEEKARQR